MPQRFQEVTAASGRSSISYDRNFYQQRIALFNRLILTFCAIFFGLVNVSTLLRHGATASTFINWMNGFLSIILIVAAVFWIYCRGRTEHSRKLLQTLDATGLVVFCGALALSAWFQRRDVFIVPNVFSAVAFVMLTRAVIIPNTTLWTAFLSILGMLPIFTVAFLTWVYPGIDWPSGLEKQSLFLFIGRGCIWAAIASVVAYIIYGLRREVRAAAQLGQYKIEEKIGEGGMGAVYRATHAMLKRPTAVKLLLEGKSGSLNLARFEREVQLTCTLKHPNTITIYDYGRTDDDVFYYAMELLEGVTLERLVKESGPLPTERVVHLLKQICGSLEEAHGHDLIHRDIKPANLVVCHKGFVHDTVKVVDFGLVKDIVTSVREMSR